jgi:hypothetical protein
MPLYFDPPVPAILRQGFSRRECLCILDPFSGRGFLYIFPRLPLQFVGRDSPSGGVSPLHCMGFFFILYAGFINHSIDYKVHVRINRQAAWTL